MKITKLSITDDIDEIIKYLNNERKTNISLIDTDKVDSRNNFMDLIYNKIFDETDKENFKIFIEKVNHNECDNFNRDLLSIIDFTASEKILDNQNKINEILLIDEIKDRYDSLLYDENNNFYILAISSESLLMFEDFIFSFRWIEPSFMINLKNFKDKDIIKGKLKMLITI